MRRSFHELRLRTRKYIDGLAIDLSKTDGFVPGKTLDNPQQPRSYFKTLKEDHDNLPVCQECRGRFGEHVSSVVDQPCWSREQDISDSLEKSLTDSFVNDCVTRYGLDRGILIIMKLSFELAHPEARDSERMGTTLAIVSFVTQLYAATQIKYHGYVTAPTSLPIDHFKTFIAKMSDDMDYRIAALEREIANLTKDEILKCTEAVRDNTRFLIDSFGCKNMLNDVRKVCDKIEKVLRAELPPSISTEEENPPSKIAIYNQFVFEIILNPRKSLNEYKVFGSEGTDKELQLYRRDEWFMIWKLMALQADHEGRENHFTIICRLMSVIASALTSRQRHFNSCQS